MWCELLQSLENGKCRLGKHEHGNKVLQKQPIVQANVYTYLQDHNENSSMYCHCYCTTKKNLLTRASLYSK